MGTHRHLLQRFFPGDVQGLHLLGKLAQRLQQQGGFPGAWITADQNGTAGHHTAAQHAVKLFKTGRKTRQLFQTDIRQLLHLSDACITGIAAEALVTRHRR